MVHTDVPRHLINITFVTGINVKKNMDVAVMSKQHPETNTTYVM